MKEILRLGLVGSLLAVALPASAQTFSLTDQQPKNTGEAKALSSSDTKGASQAPSSSSIYIIRLTDKPTATYTGGVGALEATANAVTGADRLDINSQPVVAYLNYLNGQHKTFVKQCDQALQRNVQPLFVYHHAFNGMAIELTREEAELLVGLPGVASIQKEQQYRPATDVGPAHIAAPAIWGGAIGASSEGEGAVLAILDSGINSDHPSFADIGGDGYDHVNPLGSGNYIPGSYCDVTDPSFCNDKLIGAWGLVRGPGDLNSPEDSDGHGSHTAGTAGGNHISGATIAAPTTNFIRDVSGVAPHANIIAYDVCIDSCPGSALLAALNQVIVDNAVLPDGIHALNYSISGGNNPYSDAVELGFLSVTAAGVFVSASAGNGGPGPSTTGHNSPWVASVAAQTHTRTIDNTLENFSSDGSALSNMVGAGLTAGFGPAPIVYAGNFPTSNGSSNDVEPEQCLEPFPAGTFNGEIVVCDRGAIARVAKGANVLAGGAGGFVLANTAAQGESIVADPHFLPGVHVGAAAGDVLRAWLAAESNTMATISGFVANTSASSADIMAGFSSRGPNSALDIIKPDIGAPGVSVMAPVATTPSSSGAEFGFLSGTSMSSPHNAGSAALINVLTDWTPYEIKSAMMMTSVPYSLSRKEDGVTTADPFDVGAGRLDLSRVLEAGLVLDETPTNFALADPAIGGDPKTLNIASMQDGACVGECGWTRTVRNPTSETKTYKVSAVTGAAGVQLFAIPDELTVAPGASETIQVGALTFGADADWAFGDINFEPLSEDSGPALHMPVAVKAADSSIEGVFEITSGGNTLAVGDTVRYTVSITNGILSGPLDLVAPVPDNLKLDEASLTATVTGGTTLKPFDIDGEGHLIWAGELDASLLDLATASEPSPAGFLPLALLGVPPAGCPGNCDDGGLIVDVPPLAYNGETFTQVIWSVNGTLEMGAASGQATSAGNASLPGSVVPNNLLAPLWTDLNMGVNGDGAEWYNANLTGGGAEFTVFEWSNIPLFGDSETRFSFQIWFRRTPTPAIWFVYGAVGSTGVPMTVGIENGDGTIGDTYFFNGAGTPPAAGTDLQVSTLSGGSATFTFDAEVMECDGQVINESYLKNDDTTHLALDVAACQAE